MNVSFFKEFQIQQNFRKFFQEVGNLESFFVKNIKIIKPTFVLGSPRSGTSLITEILSKTSSFGSAYQKDIPFCTTPIIWNYFSKFFYGNNKSLRIHNPDLKLTLDSSDYMDEFIWKTSNKNYKKFYLKYMDKDYKKFNSSYYKNFIKKILYLRKKNFYLSKNNNFILRVKFLKKIFPDARFIYCVRNPIFTSLAQYKINKLFMDLDKKNNNFSSKYLDIIGHYEFSKAFKPFKISNYKTVAKFWKRNDYLNSYLLQWININNFFLKKYLVNKNLKKDIFIFNYDKLTNLSSRSNLIKDLSIFLSISKSEISNELKKIYKSKNNSYYSKKTFNINNFKKSLDIYSNISKL